MAAVAAVPVDQPGLLMPVLAITILPLSSIAGKNTYDFQSQFQDLAGLNEDEGVLLQPFPVNLVDPAQNNHLAQGAVNNRKRYVS
jgi:hypothetical protein